MRRRGTRGSAGSLLPPPFQREAGRDCLSGCATRISPGIKRAGATLRPWSLSLLRQSLVLELRREELAVQTGDMRNGNLLGALGLAGSRVGAVAEAQFVHLGDHRLGAARTLDTALGQFGERLNIKENVLMSCGGGTTVVQ